MSENHLGLPDQLRRRIREEMEPVKPVKRPWKRLLYLLPVVLVALGMPWLYFQLRDTGDLGALLAWVPLAVQLLLAFALAVVALREGIPGWRVSARTILVLCLAAFGLQILVNYLIWLRAPLGGGSFQAWMGCFRVESLIGLPILVGIAWLVSRTLPQRPLVAGFLVGTGAGLAGDASWRLICPVSHPTHVMLGHTGGILILGATGFLLGYLWTVYARQTSS